MEWILLEIVQQGLRPHPPIELSDELLSRFNGPLRTTMPEALFREEEDIASFCELVHGEFIPELSFYLEMVF